MIKNYSENKSVLATAQFTENAADLNEIFRFIPSSLGDAVIIADSRRNILFMNRKAEELIGVSTAEAVATKAAEIFEITGRTDGKSIDLSDVLTKHGAFCPFGKDTELIVQNSSGQFLEGSISRIVKDETMVLGFVFIFHDVTSRKIEEGRLIEQSMRDTLTGVYNRNCFEQEVRRLQEGQYAPIGFIMCDLDGLKMINDTLGHKLGDVRLIAFANILKPIFRKTDIVARIGGDEFAIVLPNTTEELLIKAYRRIKEHISRYNEINDGLPLSVSIGYAIDLKLPININRLMRKADSNMYKEKLQQKNSCRKNTIDTIMRMIEARDFITEGHCDRLKYLVEPLAGSLGLSEDKINALRLLAEFHDIGKIGIPDRILLKRGPLTPRERKEMQKHCAIGQHVAKLSMDLAHIADWILMHHEWWNGQGYPLGIKRDTIPLECRILGILDAYDAMTHDRPYRKAMSQQEALLELRKGAGTQFDPLLVCEFTQMLTALKVFAAASFKDVMLEIKKEYLRLNPQKRLLLRFGASGELKQQIEAGALTDIFIPASLSQMDELREKELLVENSRFNFVQNDIVLITAGDSNIDCKLNELGQKTIEKIVIGDPATVPAGKYAINLLLSLGILQQVKPKLVFAEDVRQALQFVESRYMDVGIVYRTDAQISNKVKVLDQALPIKDYLPVIYPAAIIKNSSNIRESQAFLEFLTSDCVRRMLEKYGFKPLN